MEHPMDTGPKVSPKLNQNDTSWAGLEITGAKAQICACKAAHCARVYHKTVYKNIDWGQLSVEHYVKCDAFAHTFTQAIIKYRESHS